MRVCVPYDREGKGLRFHGVSEAVSASERFCTTMQRFVVTVITLAAVMLAVSCAAMTKKRWANYANPKFGTSANIPPTSSRCSMRRRRMATDNASTPRTAAPSSRSTARGTTNAKSYVENYVDVSGAAITYRQITDHLFVASGTEEREDLYQRCYFLTHPDAVVHCFSISYPEQEKTEWDKIVSRLSRSLR